MKRLVFLFPVALSLLAAETRAAGKVYPDRWVYLSSGLRNDSQVEEIRQVAKTSSEHGLTGILFSAGLDELDLQPPEYLERLKKVQDICQGYGLEIIPSIFSVGYGGSILSHDKNLAAGLPVKDALFVVSGTEARLEPDPKVGIANGGFEKIQGNKADGFTYSAEPGQVISVDTQVFKSGKCSLRFENFDRYPEEAGRLSQEVAVSPGRCYRIGAWIKSEGMDLSKPFSSGNVELRAAGGDGRPLEWYNINAPKSGDWFRVELGFNSLNNDKVKITAGPTEVKSGRFWIDDLGLEEVGLTNVLRRPGTPLAVRGEKAGTLYEEGRDYAPVSDPELNFQFDHQGPPLKIPPGSRITDKERLRVSWYHGIAVYDGQVTVCMSEPAVYEIWRRQARLIQEHLAPHKYFLAMDEIRAGGACEACKKRGLPMSRILGDCITKQVQMIREVNPQAEVFIWSDMLDPSHNATNSRAYYYHVPENYYGSWNFVPKDLNIACWYHEMRKESLAHFSGLGFKTLAAAYYDADDLENIKTWLEALDATPGARGILYTTWLDKYALLGPFGDLVSKRE